MVHRGPGGPKELIYNILIPRMSRDFWAWEGIKGPKRYHLAQERPRKIALPKRGAKAKCQTKIRG